MSMRRRIFGGVPSEPRPLLLTCTAFYPRCFVKNARNDFCLKPCFTRRSFLISCRAQSADRYHEQISVTNSSGIKSSASSSTNKKSIRAHFFQKASNWKRHFQKTNDLPNCKGHFFNTMSQTITIYTPFDRARWAEFNHGTLNHARWSVNWTTFAAARCTNATLA